jgi:hypothetical protein
VGKFARQRAAGEGVELDGHHLFSIVAPVGWGRLTIILTAASAEDEYYLNRTKDEPTSKPAAAVAGSGEALAAGQFAIYHSALRAFPRAACERTRGVRKERLHPVGVRSRLDPTENRVSNVYTDVDTSFAVSAVSNQRFCAAMIGTLIKPLGRAHVFWGTHSVWRRGVHQPFQV